MSLKPEKQVQVEGSHARVVSKKMIKPHSQVHLLSSIEKCKVCGDPAARHIHYGAVSCFSCRAFFRRSIQNKTANTYVCRKIKECQITSKTRKTCQYCRYQRCLSVGMKPSWVLSPEERERRFRRSKHKKLKTGLDEEGEERVTGGVDKFLTSNNMTILQPSCGLQSSISEERPMDEQISNLSLSKVSECEVDGGGSSGPVILNSTQSVGSEGYVKLSYSSGVLRGEGVSYSARPGQSGSPSSFSGDDESQSIYSSSSSESDKHTVSILTEPEIKFTGEEMFVINKLVDTHDERYRSVNFGEQLIKEMIMCSMFGIPISASAAMSGYNITIERITKIANNLEIFTNLPFEDRTSLLKENADLLVSLRGAIFFDSRKKGVNQVLISMGIDDLETIKTMFAPLMEREKSLNHIEYSSFNSIQKVESSPIEKRYNFLQSKVAEAVADDSIITTLITYIILFSPDFCMLQEPRKVECLQEQHIRMLERYMYSKHPCDSANHNLATALESVTCIREMADIKKKRVFTNQAKNK